MTQKLVYVAGPFRAPNCWEVQKNVMQAMEMALKIWKAGHVAICPHANTMFYQGACSDDTWLRGDLVILRKCDTLVTVGPWLTSEGSRGEVQLATELGLSCFLTWESLQDWLAEQR